MAKNKTASRPKPLSKLDLVNKEIDPPDGGDDRHLFKVTLVVLADSRCNPDQVLQHVMSSCLRHPVSLPVVNGYGAEVQNLTLSGKDRKGVEKFTHGGRAYPTGFKNRPVPKKSVPVLQVAD